MQNQNHYTVEEDICIGEALMHSGLTLTSSSFAKLHECIGDVHEMFVMKTSKFGIEGDRRTKRSLIDRVKLLRRQFQNGQLCFESTKHNCLKPQRYLLFSKIFNGDPNLYTDFSAQRTARHTEQGGRRALAKNEETEEEARLCRKAVSLRKTPESRTREGRIRKERHAKSLLHTLNNIHRDRTKMLMRREENERQEQRVLQNERRWKRDMVKRVLKSLHAEDGVCADLLKTLEDMSTNCARLCMMREEKVRERIEIDLENCEWERCTFEEVVKRYLG